MKSIIFYHIKDVAYVRLRTPYLEMYKAADLRDYQRILFEMRYRNMIRDHMPLPYKEATDPEDVAVLGYN